MTQIYDEKAPKKATNLSVNSDLLGRARGLKLNLSATLEKALADEVRKVERSQWLERNREAIEAVNTLAKRNGFFADSFRTL